MASIGVIVLTAGGNAVWYARIFEFADVLRQTCGAEIAHGAPREQSGDWGPRIRRGILQHFGRRMPGPLHLRDLFTEEPDTIIVLASGVGDLRLMPEINLPRSKKIALVLFELWTAEIPQWKAVLDACLRDFTHVAVGLSGSLDACRKLLRDDFVYLSEATDVVLQRRLAEFAPKSGAPQVFSYGRIHPAQYSALCQGWQDNKIRFRFDSTGVAPLTVPPSDHRRQLMEELAASEFVVANTSKFDEIPLTSKQTPEFGPRFVKAAAAGTIPVGQFPQAGLLSEVGLQGISVPIAESADLVDRVRALSSGERVEMARHNIATALRKHDWAYRIQSLLRLLGESPPPGLSRRLDLLERLEHDVIAGRAQIACQA